MSANSSPVVPPEIHHLTRKPLEEIEPLTITPLVLLQQAIAQGVSVDQLERLQIMHERWEAREAKKAFDAAMKDFKADAPRISKNHRVHFDPKDTARNHGPVDYRHATLDHVCDAVIGALSRHGITHRWKVSQSGEWITVTCLLTHELGHAEETSLMGCPDNSGSKNSIQAIGSTVTYLQRYTLLAATGLATTEQDDDGRGGAAVSEGLSDERTDQLGRAIANAPSIAELRSVYFAAYREAEKAKDRTAMNLFIATKDARKRELQ